MRLAGPISLLVCSAALAAAMPDGATAQSKKVEIGSHNIIVIDGKPVFPIGFERGPEPDSKTPSGADGYRELASNGTVFQLVGTTHADPWNAAAEAKLDRIMDLSAKAGLLTAISIHQLQVIGPWGGQTANELRRVVEKYSHSPSLAFWKDRDEAGWGTVIVTPPAVQGYADIVHELDPDHPIYFNFAPRDTVPYLQAYFPTYDIAANDILPVSYPPGIHSLENNKDISMVGDYTKRLEDIAEHRKPVWMIEQICWSGVVNPGRTLRMPTYPEERYMAYQAIIDGARGLIFFGGHVEGCQNDRDRKLGWNWTFYDTILKLVLNELNPKAPLYPALIVPDCNYLHVKIEGDDTLNDLEYAVRVADGYLYILAAKRQGATLRVKFMGLPPAIGEGEVLYEAPRTVAVRNGEFKDWFGPHDVHIYRFKMPDMRNPNAMPGIENTAIPRPR